MKLFFTENGEFKFKYLNEKEEEVSLKAIVTWIDKEAPKVNNIENNKVYKNDVIPEISESNIEEVMVLLNNNKIDYKIGETLSDNGNYILTVKDKAGNITTVKFSINKSQEN